MDKLIEALTALATKLGQTVEALWPHAVRYVVVEGLVLVAFGVTLGVISYFTGRAAWRLSQKEKTSHYDDYEIPIFVFSFASFLLGATALGCIFANLTQIFEPVGYLIQKAFVGVTQ